MALLPWGLATDRFGERPVLVSGLGLASIALAGCSRAAGFSELFPLLVAAGGLGASVNSASGRAVVEWFGPHERGLALGIRQTAIPIGGAFAALALPPLAAARGAQAAFLALAGVLVLGALAGAVALRHRLVVDEIGDAVPWTLGDRRLWILCAGSAFVLVAQIALMGFVVLFLHDARGLSNGEAAAVLAAIQLVGLALRVGAGAWSDRVGSRLRPFRALALAIAVALGVAAALTDAPLTLLVPAFVIAGGLSMGWNALSFAAAVELAGARRSGAAIGFQQTALALMGAIAPVAFVLAVSAASWQAAFALSALGPVLGWWLLRLPNLEEPAPD
jgi:sugar phosphate permease